MRYLVTILLLCCGAIAAKAQLPDPPLLLSFQGLLVRPDGTIYPDGQYVLNVRLYNAEENGTRVWVDDITTTVVKGIFNLIMGEQVSLKEVDFTQQLWLELALSDNLDDPFKPRTKLTSSPYAAVARMAVYAGALLPGATGTVRTLEGIEGDINLEGSGGVTVSRNGQDITIDASGVLGNLTLTTKDNVVQVEKDVNADYTWKFLLRDSSVDSSHLIPTGVSADVYGDSNSIARLVIGRDGRVKAASRIGMAQRPKNMIPNRILVSGPDGSLVEGDRLDSMQIYMGRTGGVPKRTVMKAGTGIALTQTQDTLLISSVNTTELPPLGQPFASYPGTEYIGTSNATRLYLGTSGTNRGFIESGGGWSLDGAITLSTIAGTAGTVAGSNDRILVATSAGIVNQISFAAFSAATNTSWGLTGNTTDASPFGAAPLGALFSSYAGTEYFGTSNSTRLYFGTSGTNRGYIESTGGWSLQGPFTVTDQARFAAGTAAAPSVTRDTDTDNGMFFPAGNTVAFSTGGTERVRFTDIGRVGIGNAAPAYVLDVTGDINSSTNVRAAGTALTSDKRLKRNVEPIDSALFLVNKLKPVRFEKKAAVDDTLYPWKQMGFIAQELQTVFPELVQIGADKQKTMSVDYTSLIALLTSAVQEQQAVIQDQDQRIRTLSTLLQNLEARIRALEGNSGEKTR